MSAAMKLVVAGLLVGVLGCGSAAVAPARRIDPAPSPPDRADRGAIDEHSHPRRVAGTIPVTTTSAAARAAFERGEALMDRAQRAAARPHYEAAIAADPAFAQAHLGLAGASSGAERTAHLQRARELARDLPELERLWVELVWAGTVGDPSASSLAARVVELAPASARAQRLRAGIARWHTGDVPVALAAYRAAVALAPADASSYDGLAWAHTASGDFGAAARAAEQLIKLKPDDAQAYAVHAAILLRTGQLDAAARAWARTLELDPEARCEDGLAMIELYRDRPASAAAWIRRGLTKSQASIAGTNEDWMDRIHFADLLVSMYLAIDDLDAAAAAVTEGVAVMERAGVPSTDLWRHLLDAKVLVARGEHAAAAQRLDTALADERVRARRSRLSRALRSQRLAVAIAARRSADVEAAGAALFAERTDDEIAKSARFELAVFRRDLAAARAALDGLRVDPDAFPRKRLDLATLQGDAIEVERLRRELAASHGATPAAYAARRRARREAPP
jgi:tetratricopeptide (TPR) repeat protein